jgi:PAP_fibrillin
MKHLLPLLFTADRTLKSPNVNGRWTLIYTTSRSILGLDSPAPLRSSGPIYQFIDTASLTARNEETVAPLPFLKFTRAVNAELVPARSVVTYNCS